MTTSDFNCEFYSDFDGSESAFIRFAVNVASDDLGVSGSLFPTGLAVNPKGGLDK